MKINMAFLFTCLLIIKSYAQTIPPAGARLNYTQVMFEYDAVSSADAYRIQVIEDYVGSSFNDPLVDRNEPATATLISNLNFGRKYVWRYTGLSDGKAMGWHGPYGFEITEDSFISKNIVKLSVLKNDTLNNAGGFIVNDATHTIVDRTGKIVWYLNKVDWFFSSTRWSKTVNGIESTIKNTKITPVVSDLRLTAAGTITYLADSLAIDCDLSGNVIWKAPNDGKVAGMGGESYNHDFKRLANGHYMVLGNQFWRKLPPYTDETAVKKKYFNVQKINGSAYAKVEFGTVIEYDKAGNVVWNWKSADYFDHDPLQAIIGNSETDYEMKPHINAFTTDKKNEYVYVGFRDVSRIVKVDKRTGQVVDSWGLKLPQGWAAHSVNMHLQHDANILDDGTIAVFNNNDYPGRDSFPSVIIISQTDSGKIVWQFSCDYDSLNRRATRNGGNVDQLANGNFLICLGNLDRILEVTKDKRIVWQANIKMTKPDGVDYSYRLYRAHYVSSLYPCYFVFQTEGDTISKKSRHIKLKIFNKGSENDAYSITLSGNTGKKLSELNTDTLQAYGNKSFSIDVPKHLHPGDKIEVSIRSKTNPGFERKRWVIAGR